MRFTYKPHTSFWKCKSPPDYEWHLMWYKWCIDNTLQSIVFGIMTRVVCPRSAQRRPVFTAKICYIRGCRISVAKMQWRKTTLFLIDFWNIFLFIYIFQEAVVVIVVVVVVLWQGFSVQRWLSWNLLGVKACATRTYQGLWILKDTDWLVISTKHNRMRGGIRMSVGVYQSRM